MTAEVIPFSRRSNLPQGRPKAAVDMGADDADLLCRLLAEYGHRGVTAAIDDLTEQALKHLLAEIRAGRWRGEP